MVILLVVGASALAHHSFLAEFDKSRPGELKGTIVGIWYKNPHAAVDLDGWAHAAAGFTGKLDGLFGGSFGRGCTHHR